MSIKFENVFYSYESSLKGPSAIENISFNLENHFFTGIVGHTGSGKSTLIQHINALLRPTSGKIVVGEHFIDSSKKKLKSIKELRKYAGIVFQFAEYQLFEETILKDVAFGPKNLGYSEEEAINKAKQALTLAGIDESYYEKSPFEISGGEKRRVAIAGIIALEPKILVLDEPTAGLDPRGAENLLNLFNELFKRGTSIIVVTHDMDIILKYCSNVLCLKEGKLVGNFTPTELFYNDELLKEVGIDKPEIVEFTQKLIKGGLSLDIEKIKDTSTLVEEIKRRKK